MIIMFVGIVLIFLQAIKNDNGQSWLEWVWEQLTENFDDKAVGSIVLIIIVILFMVYIVREPPHERAKKEEKKS